MIRCRCRLPSSIALLLRERPHRSASDLTGPGVNLIRPVPPISKDLLLKTSTFFSRPYGGHFATISSGGWRDKAQRRRKAGGLALFQQHGFRRWAALAPEKKGMVRPPQRLSHCIQGRLSFCRVQCYRQSRDCIRPILAAPNVSPRITLPLAARFNAVTGGPAHPLLRTVHPRLAQVHRLVVSQQFAPPINTSRQPQPFLKPLQLCGLIPLVAKRRPQQSSHCRKRRKVTAGPPAVHSYCSEAHQRSSEPQEQDLHAIPSVTTVRVQCASPGSPSASSARASPRLASVIAAYRRSFSS